MLTIHEAIEITRDAQNRNWLDVIKAAETIQQAIKNGYTLCKVDEAKAEMEKLKEQENKGIFFYYPPYYSERCIKILQEACDDR